MMFRANCRCGRISFVSRKPPIFQFNCHCSDCRKATGDSFCKTAIFVSLDCQINGEWFRRSFVADSGALTHRDACQSCSDVMFDVSERYPKLTGVLAERMAAPFRFIPSCHLWTQSKLAEVSISDGLPLYEKGMVPMKTSS